jgi:hypothetical protein
MVNLGNVISVTNLCGLTPIEQNLGGVKRLKIGFELKLVLAFHLLFACRNGHAYGSKRQACRTLLVRRVLKTTDQQTKLRVIPPVNDNDSFAPCGPPTLAGFRLHKVNSNVSMLTSGRWFNGKPLRQTLPGTGEDSDVPYDLFHGENSFRIYAWKGRSVLQSIDQTGNPLEWKSFHRHFRQEGA